MSSRKMLFTVTVGLLLACLCCPRAASAEACFTTGDFLRLRSANAPSISPDGSWVAFVVEEPPDTSRGERRSNSDIWIVDFKGEHEAQPFAFSAAKEFSPLWSPDGQWIAFLSDRGEDGKCQLYRIRVAGGEAERVTDFKEGVNSFTWSPDGERFAVIATDPVPEEVEHLREQGDDERVIDTEDRFGRLWIIDSSTADGEAVTPENLHVQSVDWSPDGTRVAMIVSDRPTSDEMYWHSRLEVLNIYSGEQKVLSNDAQGPPVWSPDGGSIAFSYLLKHPEVTVCPSVIAVIDAGGKNRRLLGRNHRSSFRSPKWLPDSDKLVVFEMAGVRGRLAFLSVTDDEVEPFEELLIPYYGWNVFDVSSDGSRLVTMKGDTKSRPDVWSIERGWFGKKRKLTNMNPWIAERTLPDTQVVKWRSKDGTEIEGVLFLPPGFAKGNRYPAVVCVHGGPMWAWWLGWHGTWHEWPIPLACRGFVVLLPNPRGSLGYGVGFARANFDDWGGGDGEDILSGTDFLVEKGYADPERIGIGGWSYGGYLSSWMVTQTKRFAAAVVGAGVTNLFSFHGTTDITPTFLEMYFRDIAYHRPDSYRNHSAINFVHQTKTPTLVVHGEDDVRVPVGQAYEFYRGLRQVGVPTELVTYPREGHAFREIYHQIDLVDRIIDWFERYLKEQ